MNDPQPKGFMTVHAAFEAYAEAIGGNDPDGMRRSFLLAFQNGILVAEVRFPGTLEVAELPRILWASGPFPGRVFLNDDIEALNGDNPWWPYRDRTAFILVSKLNWWVTYETKAQQALRDTVSGQDLTVDQALSWLIWRDVDRFEDDIFTELIADTIDDQPESRRAIFTLASSKRVLLGLLRRGLVEGLATDAISGQVIPVPPEQFAGSEIEHAKGGHIVKSGDRGGHLNMLRIPATCLIKQAPTVSFGRHIAAPLDDAVTKIEFNRSAAEFSLHEAALWFACDGADADDGDMAEGLFDIGYERLFSALSAGDVVAIGKPAVASVNGGRIPGQRGGVKAGQLSLWYDDKQRGPIGPLLLWSEMFGRRCGSG